MVVKVISIYGLVRRDFGWFIFPLLHIMVEYIMYNDFNAFHVQLPQCNKLLRITMGRQYFVDSLRTVGTTTYKVII